MMQYTPSRNQSLKVKMMRDKVYELLKQSKRIDGRNPKEPRKVKLERDVVEKADGSALVTMGGTKILAGIKVEVGTPYSDRPDEGVFTVNAELLPLASKSFEPGPPDERGVELARVVDRCIRESKAIDLKKLTVGDGEKVYVMYIDLYVLDYDGNYFDPALTSAVAALLSTKLPKYETLDGKLVKVQGEYKPVPMTTIPLSTTIGLIKDMYLVDPNLAEEEVVDTSLVISFDLVGNLVAMQKAGSGSIPINMLEELIGVASEVTGKVRSEIFGDVELGKES